MTKRRFGNTLTRLLRGGVILSAAEQEVLDRLIEALPHQIRGTVAAQFALYNLAQREVDGRALNFYRMSGFSPTMEGLPLLAHKGVEAPLVRMEFEVAGEREPLHAVLTAVQGRAFSIGLNRPIARDTSPAQLVTKQVTQAWRSNFTLPTSA